ILNFSVRALIPYPNQDAVVAALIAPSFDGVGRRYPITFFEVIEYDLIGGAFPALAVATAPFFSSAMELASKVDELSGDEIRRRLPGTPQTNASAMKRAGEICAHTLETQSVVDFEERIFHDPEDKFYAYHTVLTAVGAMAGAKGAQGPALDFPIEVDVDQ